MAVPVDASAAVEQVSSASVAVERVTSARNAAPKLKDIVDGTLLAVVAMNEDPRVSEWNKREESSKAQMEAECAATVEDLQRQSDELVVLRLTEGQAEAGATALHRSNQNMVKLTHGLFAAFTEFDTTNEDYRKFRLNLAESALTFKTTHLPLAEFSVLQVKHFLMFYSDIGPGGSRTQLSFDEWKEDLPIYIVKVDQLIKVIQTIVSLSEDMRQDLIVFKAQSSGVLEKFQLEMHELERVEGQELDAETRATWWKENVWRYIPALGPVGMLACNITINKKANQRMVHEIERKKTGLAAQCFEYILIPSADAFVECMNDFAAFFQVLRDDLAVANQKLHDLGNDGPARAHFRVVNKTASKLEESCDEFARLLPEFRSDLGAVESMLKDHGLQPQDASRRWLEQPRPARGRCWKEGLMDMADEMREFKKILSDGGSFDPLGLMLTRS